MNRLSVWVSSLIAGILLWWGWSAIQDEKPKNGSSSSAVERIRPARIERDALILERVRTAAQRKLPNVRLNGKEGVVFAEIDPEIDELDVMEILLEIESEFDIDIPQETINQQIGQEHRRDLRSHLSLSLVAEFVDGILRHPEP